MDIPMIPMEPERFGLLVAILFFLISFLVNLLQRRYSKTRLNRMLTEDESIMNFLVGIDKYLGKLEHACNLEMQGASSPKEMAKAIYAARNKIGSIIADMEEYLRSFRQYRQKEKAREKEKKRLGKSQPKPSGQ
jgi:hypothetical protein